MLNGFMLGGSGFPILLAAFVLLGYSLILSLIHKAQNRIFNIVMFLSFLFAGALNLLAPGNANRQSKLAEPLSPASSIITALLDGFDWVGQWISPQFLAVLLLILPLLWMPLKNSRLTFKHPVINAIVMYGFFASTLVPGIYSQFGYTGGRQFNVIYFCFLLAAFGIVFYAEGWLIRHLEKTRQQESSSKILSLGDMWNKRFTALYLAIVIGLLTLGGFAFTIMNTSSISAVKSLVTGEAVDFRQNMAIRQEYIRITDSDVVAVQSLPRQPYLFKADKLPFQGIYGRVRYMKWYFELFFNHQM